MLWDIIKNNNVIATLNSISEETFTNNDVKIKIEFNNQYYYFLNGICIDGNDSSLTIIEHTPKEYPIGSLPFDIDKAKNNEIIIQRIDDENGKIRWFPCRLQKNHRGEYCFSALFLKNIPVDDLEPNQPNLRMLGTANIEDGLYFTLENYSILNELDPINDE